MTDLIAVAVMFLVAGALLMWGLAVDRRRAEEGPTESMHGDWPDDPTVLIVDDYGRHVAVQRPIGWWPASEDYVGRHRRGVWESGPAGPR